MVRAWGVEARAPTAAPLDRGRFAGPGKAKGLEFGDCQQDGKDDAVCAGAPSLEGDVTSPELAPGLQDEVVGSDTVSTGYAGGGLDARIPLLLDPEVLPVVVVVVNEARLEVGVWSVKQDEFMNWSRRVVAPAVRAEQAQLVVGIPTRMAHPFAGDDVSSGHPEPDWRGRVTGGVRCVTCLDDACRFGGQLWWNAFIGVDKKDPPVAPAEGFIDREGPLPGPPIPVSMQHDCPAGAGEVDCGIGTATVDNHLGVGPRHGIEARLDVPRLVAGQDAGDDAAIVCSVTAVRVPVIDRCWLGIRRQGASPHGTRGSVHAMRHPGHDVSGA